MQAIVTNYLPATNTKPSRIKATCSHGDAIHEYAAGILCARFVKADQITYGTQDGKNSWGKPRVMGTLPNGDVAHVFVS